MSFQIAVAAKTNAKSAKPRTSKGQQGIQAFTKRVSNPISRKRSAQQILAEEEEFDKSGWGDTDDEYIDDPDSSHEGGDRDDPIELDTTDIDDAVPLAKAAGKKRKVTKPAPKVSAEVKSKAAKVSEAPWKRSAAAAGGARLVTLDKEDVEHARGMRKDTQSPVEQCLRELREIVDKACPIVPSCVIARLIKDAYS